MLDHHTKQIHCAPVPASAAPAPQSQASPSAPPSRPHGPQPYGKQQPHGKKR